MTGFAGKPRARPALSPMQRKPATTPVVASPNLRSSTPGLLSAAGPAVSLGTGAPDSDQRRDLTAAPPAGMSARESLQRAVEQLRRPSPQPLGVRPAAGAVPGRPTVDRPDSARERAAEATAARLVGESPAAPPPGAVADALPPPGPAVDAALAAGDGEPLSPAERAEFEPKLAADLSPVRVHDSAVAHAAAAEIGARAFTHGRDIYFAAGERRPGDPASRRLLAHELAHTVAPAAPGLLLPDRDVEADFAGRPTYPAAATATRPAGTIRYLAAPSQPVYAPYVIYRPEDVPTWLYELRMKTTQPLRLGGPGGAMQGTGQAPAGEVTLGGMVEYARRMPEVNVRLMIADVAGAISFVGYDESEAFAGGRIGGGFIESSRVAPGEVGHTGGVARVLFADRVMRALATGAPEMVLEIGHQEGVARFHDEIRRAVGQTGTPSAGYSLNTREMIRLVLSWSDVLTPGERLQLARLAAMPDEPTPAAAQGVLTSPATAAADTAAERVGPAPSPLGPQPAGETMAMIERFREQLRGRIRQPFVVEDPRELTEPAVQARVLRDYFGFAMTADRLYRLEPVGQGVRISEVVPEPIVEPIAAPVGPVAPLEGPVIEPQVVNLDPSRAIRIGENVIPPSETIAVLAPGEFIVGYSPNQLVALDPLTGRPLLGVYEGGQWYQILDANQAPLDFDPATGQRIVNLGTAETPIPALELDTDLGPQQTTFQRAPVSSVAVGIGGIIMVANELMKWAGATLEVQRATIERGKSEIDLWTRLGAAPVAGIWNADANQPDERSAKPQTGIVFSTWRFPYVADIDADRLRTELPRRITSYSEYGVLLASLGQLGALTEDHGRMIVHVSRPQFAAHKSYDITEALNTVVAQTLAAADLGLRERLAVQSAAGQRGRILHVKHGATLYRSESESMFELRRQPLIDAGDQLGSNAWVREIHGSPNPWARQSHHGKLFVEPVNADAYQAVALVKYMILKDIEDVWKECKAGGREVFPKELPSFSEGPFTSFQAGPETTGEMRFGWTRYVKRPEDPDLAATPNSTIAFGELRAFWVSEDDTTPVIDAEVESYLRD